MAALSLAFLPGKVCNLDIDIQEVPPDWEMRMVPDQAKRIEGSLS